MPPLKTNAGTSLTSDIDKANLLNSYFQTVFTKDDGNIPNFPDRLGNNNAKISDINLSTLIIHKIKKKKN